MVAVLHDLLKRPDWWLVIMALLTGLAITWQAWETRKSVNAANLSANAIRNGERAWIMVHLEFPMLGCVDTNDGRTNISIRMICRNDGRTPAWIEEKRIVLQTYKSVPKKPELSGGEVQGGPEPIGVGGATVWDIAVNCDGVKDFDNWLLLYGAVKYRDVFGEARETFFGYSLDIGNNLDCLRGYREYNKNT